MQLPHFLAPFRYVVGTVSGLTLVMGTLSLVPGASAQSGRVFETVEVRGAEFIPEQDIKMTCGAVPDVSYLDLELRAIEECLMSTGVFESVTLTPEGDTLVIAVKELNTRPGRAEASLSYASQDGVIGGLFFERYNLFPDTYGSVRLEYNAEVTRAKARLYHVDVIGDSVDLGVKAGFEEVSFDDTSYTHDTKQLETYLAWTPSGKTRLEAGLGYRDYGLSDVEPNASALLKAEATPSIAAPFLRLGLKHDSLDEGDSGWGAWEYSFGLDQYYWNLGTDDSLTDFRIETRSYLPLGSNLRMLISMDAGTVSGRDGNPTRVIDRFTPGADEFRGFAPRGIGPRDQGDALGGQNYLVSSIELQHRFEDVAKSPFVAGVFWQTGAAWGLDDTQGGTIDDDFYQRSSIGLSLSFEVANAPVSVYVASPIEKEAGDKEQLFGLSLSAKF